MHLGRPAKAFALFSLILVASTLCIYRLAATSTAGSVAFVVEQASPSATATSALPLNLPNHVAISDLNGDTCPDLVVPNKNNDSIAIFLNSPTATGCSLEFTQSSIQLAAGSKPTQVSINDFDGDGHLDIAVVEQGSAKVEVFLGKGDGAFTSPAVASVNVCGTPSSTSCLPSALASGDLNGDGVPDIAIGYGAGANGGTATVGLFVGGRGLSGCLSQTVGYCLPTTPAPTFENTVPAGRTVFGIVMAPLKASSACAPVGGQASGTGECDIAATDSSNSVDIFQNATMAHLPLSIDAGVAFATGIGTTGPLGLAAGDLNGDGKIDLVVANSVSNQAAVLLNSTSGSTINFAMAADYAVGHEPASVAIADLDSDGHPDLAVANFNDNNISVLRGVGDGTFVPFSNSPIAELMTDMNPIAIAAGDLNGDALIDLAVANRQSDSVTMLLNSQVFVTAGATPPSPANDPQPVAPGTPAQTVLTFNLKNSQAAAIQVDSIAVNFTASAGNLEQNVAASGVTLAESSPMATPVASTDFSGCAGPGQSCVATFNTSGFTLPPGTTTALSVAVAFNGSSLPALGTLMSASVSPASIGLHTASAALVSGATLTNNMIVAAISAGSGAANFATNEAPGATNVPALQFTLSASPGLGVQVSSLNFQVNGGSGAVVNNDVTQVGVVEDLNGDGFVDSSETTLATAAVNPDGTTTLTFGSPLQLTGGTTRTFLLFYDFAANKGTAGATYQAQLTGGSATTSGGGSPITIQGVPLGSNNTKTISTTAGSLAVEIGANNPGNSATAPGNTNVPMLLLQAFASSVENVQLNSIVITNTGSGNPETDVTAVKVYLDNGDGVFNAGETQLGAGTFTGSKASISFTGSPPVAQNGQPLFLLVTYDFANTASPATTFSASLAAPADLAAVGSTQNDLITPEFETTPLAGGIVTIQAAATPTPTSTATSTSSPTPTATPTATATATATATPTATPTPTPTPVAALLRVAPNPVAFFRHKLGTTTARRILVLNARSNKNSVLLESFAVNSATGDYAVDPRTTCTQSETLSPGQRCFIFLDFKPSVKTAQQEDTGMLTVQTDAETVGPRGTVVQLKGGGF